MAAEQSLAASLAASDALSAIATGRTLIREPPTPSTALAEAVVARSRALSSLLALGDALLASATGIADAIDEIEAASCAADVVTSAFADAQAPVPATLADALADMALAADAATLSLRPTSANASAVSVRSG